MFEGNVGCVFVDDGQQQHDDEQHDGDETHFALF